jgi:hypothetical protein
VSCVASFSYRRPRVLFEQMSTKAPKKAMAGKREEKKGGSVRKGEGKEEKKNIESEEKRGGGVGGGNIRSGLSLGGGPGRISSIFSSMMAMVARGRAGRSDGRRRGGAWGGYGWRWICVRPTERPPD